jgi:adenylate cyclase class IV
LNHLRGALSVQTGKKLPLWPTEFLVKHNYPLDLMERELKILEIDTASVMREIHAHNPRLIFHGPVEDTRYDFPPGHTPLLEETMRIRKKNNDYVLTLKRKNISKDIKEREEFEVGLHNPALFEETFMAL